MSYVYTLEPLSAELHIELEQLSDDAVGIDVPGPEPRPVLDAPARGGRGGGADA